MVNLICLLCSIGTVSLPVCIPFVRVLRLNDDVTPSRIVVTVWVLRPTVKRAPSEQELQSDPRQWMNIHGFEKPSIRRPTDESLLKELGKLNPLLSVGGVQQKVVATIPSDKDWAATLASRISFQINVKARSREEGFNEVARTSGKEMAVEMRKRMSQQILMKMDVYVPHIEETRLHGGNDANRGTRVQGYRGVMLDVVYAVNPNLDYGSKQGPVGAPSVRQIPSDIVLFQLSPLVGKGENPR